MQLYDVIVVGAGPYGLSVAAHIKALGLSLRIFGSPMQTWREQMPAGMLLKSDGFASNLSDPDGSYALRHHCAERGLAYDDRRVPVKLSTFVDYGTAFQQRFLPELDQRNVTSVAHSGTGFLVEVEGGERFQATRLVLAVGISHFAYTPPELSSLPAGFVSHSSAHRSPERFRGEDVTILGAGASAVDLATLLHEAGAKVCLLTRRKRPEFHDPPTAQPHNLGHKLRYPSSGLGPGWPSWLYSNAPRLFRRLPERQRLSIVRTHLGPAGGWAMRNRFEGNVEVIGGLQRMAGCRMGSRLRLSLATDTGEKIHSTGHLIAATGYRPSLVRLRFLDDGLRSQLKSVADSPTLSSDFESSVPGLYFVGISSAASFGPLMRFAFGSGYTAQHLATHLDRATRVGRGR